MARQNYSYEKRQKELAKKRKKEEKKQRKLEAKAGRSEGGIVRDTDTVAPEVETPEQIAQD